MQIFKVIVLIGLLHSVSSTFFPVIPGPVVFWAGNDYFLSNNQYLESTSSRDVASFISSMITHQTTESALQKLHASTHPELIVLWIADKTDIVQLKPILDASASSLILPYVYKSTEQISSMVINSTKKSEVSIVVAQDPLGIVSGATRVLSVSNLRAYLQTHNELFTNAVTDLLIVHLDGGMEVVTSINSEIQTLSVGNYVSAFYTEQHSSTTEAITAVHNQITVMQHDLWHYAQGKFWPSAVWEGIITAFVLIIMLIIGVGCTATVQTPAKWASESRFQCQFTELNDP